MQIIDSYFSTFFCYVHMTWLSVTPQSKASSFEIHIFQTVASKLPVGLSCQDKVLSWLRKYVAFEVQWVWVVLSHRLLQWFGGKATCNIISGHMKSQFVVTNSVTELLGYLQHNLWPLEALGCLVCSYWSSLEPAVLGPSSQQTTL